MSLLDSLTRFSTATADGSAGGYQVTRIAAGSMTQGRYVAGSTTTFTIDAVVVPSSGREIRVLPEGQFAEDTKILLTSTPLVTMSPTNVPDTVVITGDTYSVAAISGPWNIDGVTIYKVSVARQRVP